MGEILTRNAAGKVKIPSEVRKVANHNALVVARSSSRSWSCEGQSKWNATGKLWLDIRLFCPNVLTPTIADNGQRRERGNKGEAEVFLSPSQL